MATDIFDILQPRTIKEATLGSLPGGKTKSEQPFTLETIKDIEQIKSHGEWLDMMEKIQEFKAPEDYFTLTNTLEARKVREKLGEAINKKGEELGFTSRSDEDYDRFDRGPWGSEEAKKSGMATDQAIAKAKAIASGAGGKKKETPYEGPFGKIGEYFSKNADARDKLFDYMTSVGRELVKPIEPGKQAAGALIPTLVRGMEAGEKKYAAEKLAETEMLLKRSEAAQKANPLQYFTSKMKELRYEAVNAGVDPDTAEGARWMGQQLSQIGISENAALLSKSIKDAQDALVMITDPDKKKVQQETIDKLNGQLIALINQGLDGGASGTTVPYMSQ